VTPRERLRTDIQKAEGTGPQKNGRMLPYWDCCGKPLRECTCNPRWQGNLTIGWGRNLEANGIRLTEGDLFINNDIDDAVKDVTARYGVWFDDLQPPRQAVLVEMCFNLGLEKFSKFKRMIAAVARQDYDTAAVEMLASKWADDVGPRALRLAEQMRSGQWPA
jgi:lysozyme